MPIRCEACGEEVRRIPEVGDVWLDAGIVPFSTLGWQNAEWVEGGNGTGAARGLTGADLPDHAYWEQWFPADWVSEMREQIRLWFYSQLFMSVALVGRAPFQQVLGYEKMLDEHGREMHGSWGNMIDARRRVRAHGRRRHALAVLRAAARPEPALRLRPRARDQARLLTLWNSVKFLVDYANIEGFRPTYGDLESGPAGRAAAARPLARRAHAAARRARRRRATRRSSPSASCAPSRRFVDDLSNWYIRRSRRRFYGDDEAAFRTLWYALVQALRVIAPVMPFLAEHLWQNLVAARARTRRRRSTSPAGRSRGEPDEQLLAEMAEVRRSSSSAAGRARPRA